MNTKYGYEISDLNFSTNINRLTNQIWKLIPMRENEENWKGHLDTVIIEIVGLNEIFDHNNLLILLTKLEGLKVQEIDFELYRKTVFEAISLLRGIRLCVTVMWRLTWKQQVFGRLQTESLRSVR